MGDIMTLHNIARVPVMVCFLLSAMTIQATPVKWEISGLTFTDGGSGSGYFVFDADTAAVSDWEIDVAGGTTTELPAIQYNVNNSSSDVRATDLYDELSIVFDIGLRQLMITPFSSLTNSGGSIEIDTQSYVSGAGSIECISCVSDNDPYRNIDGGTLTASSASSSDAPVDSSVHRVALEEPVAGEIHTGVGNLRGWAVATDGISKVEIFIDGAYQFDAPYGGRRNDVGGAFPDVEDSSDSGFSLAWNYSDLSAGPHTITAVAHTATGATQESSASFNVVKFDSFIAAENAVDLNEGSCSLSSDEISIFDARVEGYFYDLVLKWRTAEQGFEIIEIR